MIFFLPILCITCHLIAKSQQTVPILDMTAVYERLLKRITEIERGLDLHLNYNTTRTSPRENVGRIYAKQSEDEVKDGVQRKETSFDAGSGFFSGDYIQLESHVTGTGKITRRKRVRQKVTYVLSSNVKSTGGTKGPRTFRRSRKKQTKKHKHGRQDLQELNRYPAGGDSKSLSPMPSQCPIDRSCGCCAKKTGNPQVPPPTTLSQSEIATIQKQIDDLVVKGCKVYHFQGSIFYSCDDK